MSHRGVTLPETYLMDLVSASLQPSPQSTEQLREAIGHAHPRARVIAMRGLARLDELSVVEWSLLLSDPDSEVRRETLSEIGSRGTCPVPTDLLCTGLSDEDPLVAEAAAFALGECAVVEAESALIAMVQSHDDARCRETAVVSLGLLGLDSSRNAIIGALDDKPTVRRRAVVALANFDGDDIEAALDRAAEDRDWQVRSAVEQLRREN